MHMYRARDRCCATDRAASKKTAPSVAVLYSSNKAMAYLCRSAGFLPFLGREPDRAGSTGDLSLVFALARGVGVELAAGVAGGFRVGVARACELLALTAGPIVLRLLADAFGAEGDDACLAKNPRFLFAGDGHASWGSASADGGASDDDAAMALAFSLSCSSAARSAISSSRDSWD